MGDLIEEKFFTPRLIQLVQCLTDELDKAGGPGRCYTGLMVGTMDPLGLAKCTDGQCGVAWVRPVSIYETASFPQGEDGPTGPTRGVAGPMAMEVEIGVGRCYPRLDQRDAFPDPQKQLEATMLYMSDMRAARRALLCCFVDANPQHQAALGAWSPLEPQMGWSGGVWQGWIG